MKKLFVLFGLVCVIALAGCGGGGGGGGNGNEAIVTPTSAVEYLEQHNYGTINTSYISMENNLASAIANKATEGAVASYVNLLMDVFSDDFIEGEVNKTGLTTKLINKISSNTDVISNYSVSPIMNSKYTDNETGYIDSDGYLHVITLLSVTKNKLSVTKPFDVKWKNEGTAENPNWKIISGFPTSSSDF